MCGPVYEFGISGIHLLKASELIRTRRVSQETVRIPARIRRKARVEQIQASKILNFKSALKIRSQLGRREQMEAERAAATVAEFEFAQIVQVVVFQATYVLDRINQRRRHATVRPVESLFTGFDVSY